MPKGTKLGPRVTVLVATKKAAKGNSSKQLYAYMLKSVADHFGFKAVPDAFTTTKKKTRIAVRGSKGASIKVPKGGETGKNSSKKMVSIAMPSQVNLQEVKAFLKQATKNKPESFVSKFGRTHPVGTGK